MPESRHIPILRDFLELPLEQFFAELQANGFARDRLGIPLQKKAAELVGSLSPEASVGEFKFKLAALLCHSAEEQTAFYPLFDAFIERLQPAEAPEAPRERREETPQLPPPIPPAEPPPPQKKPEVKKPGHSSADEVKSALSGPITVELRFRDDGFRPWNLPEMESIVRPLREKEPAGAEEWDLPKTIRQTILAGGAPRFVTRRRRRSPQYLLLIEQKSVHDHLAGCYADLAVELSRRDLDVAWYFYDRLPHKCWKDRRDPSTYTTIERLAATYSGSRLLLIGEPDALLAFGKKKHPKTGQWTPVIHRYPSEFAFRLRDEWPAVALLNTRSTAQWGEAEAAICRLMPLVPANTAGLASLMDQWKSRSAYTPDFWKLESPEPAPPALSQVDLTPANVRAQLKNLKFYLGRHGYSWLCAISVYPEIYWALTKILHDEAISASDVPDESQRSRLWHLFLLRMSRLEWLRSGHIPPEYRQELRQELSNEHAAAVRRQLLEVLQLDENKAPEGSYAYNDRVFTVALLQHEQYVAQERPGPARLTALQEKLRQEIAAVPVSDIEDAVGKSLYRNIPEAPEKKRPVFWVLWVDDSPGNNASYQRKASEENPIEFVNATSTTEALKALSNQDFQLVVSDVSRHGDKEAGIKMMRQFRDRGIASPVVFFTHPGYVSKHREMLRELGAAEVVSGFEELRKLMEQYRSAADPLEQGNAALDRAEALEKERLYTEAGAALQQAATLFEQIGDKGKQGDALQKLGKLYVGMKRNEEAGEAFSRALDLFYAVDFGAAQAFVLMDLGRLEKTTQQYEKALGHYNEALDALEDLAGDTDEEQLEVLFELADIARLMGNAEGALRYADQGYRKAEGKRKWAFRFALLRGDVSLLTLNYATAMEYYRAALDVAETDLEQAQTYDQLAAAALTFKRTEDAINYLREAEKRYEAIGGHPVELLDIREKLKDLSGERNVDSPEQAQTNIPENEQSPPDDAVDELSLLFICHPADQEHCIEIFQRLRPTTLYLATALMVEDVGRLGQPDINRLAVRALSNDKDAVWREIEGDPQTFLTISLEQADTILPFISPKFTESEWLLNLITNTAGSRLNPVLVHETTLNDNLLRAERSLPAAGRYIDQYETAREAYDLIAEGILRQHFSENQLKLLKLLSIPEAPPGEDHSTDSLVEADQIKLYFVCARNDKEYEAGLNRHLQRSEARKNRRLLLYSVEMPQEPYADWEKNLQSDLSKADHIFLFLSDAFFQEFGVLENALGENKAKLRPILIRRTERSFTFLEDIQTLPAGSRNRYITQFEDREDAYYVLRKNVEEMLEAQTVSDPQEETATAPPFVEEVTDFAEESPDLRSGNTLEVLAVIQNALKMGLSRPILEDLAKALPDNPEARQLLEAFDMLEKAKKEGTMPSATIAYRRRELLKKAQDLASRAAGSGATPAATKKKASKKAEPAKTKKAPEKKQEQIQNDWEPEMIFVQGGTFQMGSQENEQGRDDNETQHPITLSDFYIAKYPVTQKLWKAVMGENPSHFKGDDLPVESVSWEDCQEFIRKLNDKTGKTYRLPTEAEWEFAARGGTLSEGFIYAGSNQLDEVAWYSGNSGNKTQPVGQMKPNELGLLDMTGNVREWCMDWYGADSATVQQNPTGPTSGFYRVYRGGSWNYTAQFCRVAFRSYYTPEGRRDDLGFRLVSSDQQGGFLPGDDAKTSKVPAEQPQSATNMVDLALKHLHNGEFGATINALTSIGTSNYIEGIQRQIEQLSVDWKNGTMSDEVYQKRVDTISALIRSLSESPKQEAMVSRYKSNTTRIFILVDSSDRTDYQSLMSHINGIEDRGAAISTFSPFDVEKAESWVDRLQFEMEQAEIFILLVSDALLYSKTNVDMLQIALASGRVILPVLLKPANLVGTGLEKYQLIPDNNVPYSKIKNKRQVWEQVQRAIIKNLPKPDADAAQLVKGELLEKVGRGEIENVLKVLPDMAPAYRTQIKELLRTFNHLQEQFKDGIVSPANYELRIRGISASLTNIILGIPEPQTIKNEPREMASVFRGVQNTLKTTDQIQKEWISEIVEYFRSTRRSTIQWEKNRQGAITTVATNTAFLEIFTHREYREFSDLLSYVTQSLNRLSNLIPFGKKNTRKTIYSIQKDLDALIQLLESAAVKIDEGWKITSSPQDPRSKTKK